MSHLSAIRASNAAISHSISHPPVAIFVGGTSGIGQAMAEKFAHQTKGNSDILIIGRNRVTGERILASLPSPASGNYAREFIQCDITLMKNIHDTTQDILSRHSKINYLVMSPSFLAMNGRDDTSEGIDKKLAVHYYARWKFINDLLPALKTAKDAGEEGAIVTVLSAGRGGSIDVEDLGLKKNYSIANAALSASTYNDLMLEAFSEKAPNIPFIHAHPGIVRTPALASSDSLLFRTVSPILLTLTRPWSISSEECAEYMWSAVYSTTKEPGVYRKDPRGADLGKTRYFGDAEQMKKLWNHTELTDIARLCLVIMRGLEGRGDLTANYPCLWALKHSMLMD